MEHFAVVVTEDDVTRLKPDPEAVLMAAEKVAVHPSELLVVGDSPADMQAARLAGAPCGAALWGFYGRKAAAHADWAFERPSDVLKVYSDSTA